jgi:hypothetical protein
MHEIAEAARTMGLDLEQVSASSADAVSVRRFSASIARSPC